MGVIGLWTLRELRVLNMSDNPELVVSDVLAHLTGRASPVLGVADLAPPQRVDALESLEAVTFATAPPQAAGASKVHQQCQAPCFPIRLP